MFALSSSVLFCMPGLVIKYLLSDQFLRYVFISLFEMLQWSS